MQVTNWLRNALVIVLLSRIALAAGMKEAAEGLPGEVMVALLVRDLKEADADYRMGIEKVGLKELVPPDQREPLARLKEKLPGLKAFDERGSLAVVILKSKSLPELVSHVAVLLPATDPARLLEDLGGDPAGAEDDKVRAVLLFGKTMYATATARHVAVSKSADVCRQLTRQKTTLLERLSPQEIDSLDDLDAAIWLDASALLGIFKPQIDGLVGWALMMQMGSGDVGEEEARATKKQVDLAVEGLSSLLIGLSLSQEGLSLRFTGSTKPGSEFAKQTQHVVAEQPLLRGLPRRNYLFVFGQEFHPAYLQAAISSGIDPIMADWRKEMLEDQEKIEEIRKNLARAAETIRAVRGSVDHLGGSEGMIAASLVLETSDSRQWIEVFTQLINTLGRFAEVPPDDGQPPEGPPLKWMPAEPIEGVQTTRLTFHSDDFEEDEMETARAILGPELLSVRFAPADEKNVAITIGGGAGQMGRLIRSIHRNQSPLEEETGIALAAKNLPKKSGGVAYVALDRVVNFFQTLSYEIEDAEPFPFWLPRVDAPLGLTVSGGDGWARYDIFAPMPLLAAVVEGIHELDFDNSDIESEDEVDPHDTEQDQDPDEPKEDEDPAEVPE